jgi:hypothetical protein
VLVRSQRLAHDRLDVATAGSMQGAGFHGPVSESHASKATRVEPLLTVPTHQLRGPAVNKALMRRLGPQISTMSAGLELAPSLMLLTNWA